MVQEKYRLRAGGSNEEVMYRLRHEILKLESQLSRLQVENVPLRFSLMKTYKTMIAARQDLLVQLDG